MDQQANVQALFQKYLAGEYTEKELETLLAYFQLPEESAILTDLILQELNSDVSFSDVQHMADTIGQRLLQRIEQPRATRSLVLFRTVAAAILFLLLTGAAVYYYVGRQHAIEIVQRSKYGSDVLPGRNRATITLDNGTSIALSEEKKGVVVSGGLAYTDGTSIETGPTSFATLHTPNGGQYRLTLPDGTEVWLNAASSLRYPSVFRGNTREVELTGEAYFAVKPQEDKPFVVSSAGQKVKVLGTEFNVNHYANQAVSVTTLINGRVEVENMQTRHVHRLEPGQQSLVSAANTAVRTVADAADYVAWKNGYIIMTGATLLDVVPQLERWYDVHFDMQASPSIKAYIALNRQAKLSEVLDALALNYQVNFKIIGRRVLVIE